jgi:hypothetical protein
MMSICVAMADKNLADKYRVKSRCFNTANPRVATMELNCWTASGP